MRIQLGIGAPNYQRGEQSPVVWDSEQLINGHLLIVGKSGTGKTHTIRHMLRQMASNSRGNFRCHVMDVHGDIDIPGASTVKFSESTQYGFNPLTINPDPDFGGVRKRIQSFMGALARTGYRLGPKQEATLRNVLYDLYAANGFYENDAKSWRINDGINRRYPKKQPGMNDAVKFARAKLKSMFLGTNNRTISILEALYRKQNQLYRRLKDTGRQYNTEDMAKLEGEIEALKKESMDLFQEHLATVQTGTELNDLLKYDSKDVMKSVVDRLENLDSVGIFRPERPPFDGGNPIWRYDIKALMKNEKKLFVSFILEAIFLRAVQRGEQSDIVETIVLDEARMFLDDDPENPINIIANEARKFGLNLIAASQSPTHFSDDFLSNVGSKIILGIDEMYWHDSVRKLQLEMKDLEFISPTKTFLMQMNLRQQTSTKNNWLRVFTQA